jgi:electron transfer flavoprotein alpha subunit
MTEFSDILVIGAVEQNEITADTKEILSGARRLADGLTEQVVCVLPDVELGASAVSSSAAYGADRVLTAEDKRFQGSGTEVLMPLVASIIEQKAYRVILAGRWHLGWLARLATKSGAVALGDIIAIEPAPSGAGLSISRPVYGGKAIETVGVQGKPVFATVRPKAMAVEAPDDSRQATAEPLTLDGLTVSAAIEVTGVEQYREEGVSLEDATVIVAGGRGIGGAEPFAQQMKELAEILGGVVGASRPPADDGWVSHHLHIGLTGKIVTPELYVAIGISGASQHMAGCNQAKTIVAINKDKEAAIFKQADFGVVGRHEQILPALSAKLKALAG